MPEFVVKCMCVCVHARECVCVCVCARAPIECVRMARGVGGKLFRITFDICVEASPTGEELN